MNMKFGPAGNAQSFTELGYRHSMQVPEYLTRMGLDCFEYQCGRGVAIGLDKAAAFGEAMAAQGLSVSLHAPYYISMSSTEPEKRDHSIDYILQSAAAVNAMGGDRIVVHTGSCGKISREQALDLACDTMRRALAALDEAHLGHIHICPETMGKINQLGTLDEVLALCALDERLLPCVDFGHLNARTLGGLSSPAAFAAVFDAIENRLGADRLRAFHVHFSKIEYTAGGEKRHLTFADEDFGPSFEPMLDLALQKGCALTVICESAGTQAEDAATMKTYYRQQSERSERR